MSQKENIKINLSTFFLIIAIIIIIIMGYYIYILTSNENKPTTEVSQSNTFENSNLSTENVVTEIDINSNLIQSLYKYITKLNYSDEKIVYQTKKVTLSDLSNHLKLLTIFNNLKDTDANEIIELPSIYGITVTHTIFSKDTFEKKGKEIFGNNLSITNETFEPIPSKIVEYKDEKYDYYDVQGRRRCSLV